MSKPPVQLSQHLRGEFNAELAPGLYVVATPIGNLRDISLRALDILTSVDHILAEDTRQTAKLLDAYDIQAKLTAYHDHNVAARIPQVMDWLSEGRSVALVSDAGTPLVSDPGFKLVREAIAKGYEVFPLPGASAPLAALVKSGLPTDRFLFAGFLPPKTSARKKVLGELADIRATLILFETGPRIQACLTDIGEILGERDLVLTRELTKKYEEARYGTVKELIASVISDPPRGEIVLLIGPPTSETSWDAEKISEALSVEISKLGVKRASAKVAQASGWAKRDVYNLALKLK